MREHIADAYAYTIVNWANFLMMTLAPYPGLKAYLARVAQRAARAGCAARRGTAEVGVVPMHSAPECAAAVLLPALPRVVAAASMCAHCRPVLASGWSQPGGQKPQCCLQRVPSAVRLHCCGRPARYSSQEKTRAGRTSRTPQNGLCPGQ